MRTNVSGTVYNVTRIKNSDVGSPRYAINIDGTSYRTSPNNAVNGDIPNMMQHGLIDSTVVVVIDGRDNIVGLEITGGK